MAFSIQYWSIYTKDFVKIARKSESAVASDRVLRFVFHSDIQCIVANVQASMKDKSYKVEVQLDEGNILKTSSCECPMKEFKCHHVAAVLLYGYKSASKTDIKCSWIKHPKSVPPKEIKTMDDLYPCRQPEYKALPRPFSVRDRDTLYRELGGLGRFTGIWFHESGVLAASPDGLVVQQPGPVKRGETAAAHKQLLEVKCPYSAKDMTVMQAATSMKEFFLGVESKRLHLKPSHDYWHQIQGQLHITGAEVCDLAVWTTKDFQVIRINKAAEWQGNLARLIDFYFSHFIPSMINP